MCLDSHKKLDAKIFKNLIGIITTESLVQVRWKYVHNNISLKII
jgi:hypothetical protein